MSLTHKQKVKLARRLNGGKTKNVFTTPAWNTHKSAIVVKVAKTVARQQAMAEERRKKKAEEKAHGHQ